MFWTCISPENGCSLDFNRQTIQILLVSRSGRVPDRPHHGAGDDPVCRSDGNHVQATQPVMNVHNGCHGDNDGAIFGGSTLVHGNYNVEVLVLVAQHDFIRGPGEKGEYAHPITRLVFRRVLGGINLR
jgi:hypothetical protein